MKSIVKFLTFGVVCAGLALAQRTAPDPAEMVKRQVERLTQTLSLTSAQQAQATTLFTTNAQTTNQSVMTRFAGGPHFARGCHQEQRRECHRHAVDADRYADRSNHR